MLSTINFSDIHACLLKTRSMAHAAEVLGEDEVTLETYLSAFRFRKYPGRALTFEEWNKSDSWMCIVEYGAAYHGPIDALSLPKAASDASLIPRVSSKKHMALVSGQSLASIHRVVSDSTDLAEAAELFETSTSYLEMYFQCFSYAGRLLDYATIKALRHDQLALVETEKAPPSRLYIDSLAVIHHFCQGRIAMNAARALGIKDAELASALRRLTPALTMKQFQAMSLADLRRSYGAACDEPLPSSASVGRKRASMEADASAQQPEPRALKLANLGRLPVAVECPSGGAGSSMSTTLHQDGGDSCRRDEEEYLPDWIFVDRYQHGFFATSASPAAGELAPLETTITLPEDATWPFSPVNGAVFLADEDPLLAELDTAIGNTIFPGLIA